MEVLSLRVTVNICCQFSSFVFSNQGSQLRNKQTGRGGYLKDKIHSRFIEHKERNDFSSTSTLPPKVLCFKCNQENFSRKGHSASASTTRLCQGTVRVQWGPQTSPRRTSQVHSHNGHTFQLKFHVICARHRVFTPTIWRPFSTCGQAASWFYGVQSLLLRFQCSRT